MKAARTLIERHKSSGGALKALADDLFALPAPPAKNRDRSVADIWNDAEDDATGGEPRTVWDEIDRARDDGTLTAAEHDTLGDIYDRRQGRGGS